MTIIGKAFSQAALCTAEVEEGGMFSLSKSNLDTSAIGAPGSSVQVRIFKRSPDDAIKPLDSATFNGQLLPDNKILIDPGVQQQLDIEAGDVISYVVISSDAIPGFFDGPVRSFMNQSPEGNNVAPEERRGERTTTQATFETKMRQTGQFRIPADVRDSMALIEGDELSITVEHEGQSVTYQNDMKTGGRTSIRKKERQQVGLNEVFAENGTAPITVTIQVPELEG